MTPLQLYPHRLDTDLIEAAINHHGALAVAKRALRAMLRRKRTQTAVHDLSDHLMRDVGLDPSPKVTPYWEYMR